MPWLLPGSAGDLESGELAKKVIQSHAEISGVGVEPMRHKIQMPCDASQVRELGFNGGEQDSCATRARNSQLAALLMHRVSKVVE